MGERTIIPFGPHHPVLPEPIHLDLVLEDETVVQAIPNIGFIHRGLELLCKKKTYDQMSMVGERICGICSMTHGIGTCQSIEYSMGIEVPERAQFLRVFLNELGRIQSHVLWLGLAADAIGFESLFMHSWRVRELVLDILEELTGGRVIFSIAKVGGLKKEIGDDTLKRILTQLDKFKNEFDKLAKVFTDDLTVTHRWSGVGMLSRDDAMKLGAVGPVARASGVRTDARLLGYGAYKHMNFEPVVTDTCDCYGRAYVRVKEVFQALDLIKQSVAKMPKGEVDMKIKGFPEGEFFGRLEQPRGEVIYYIKGNGTKYLERFRVRTPTFANVPPLVKMLAGVDLADVPAIVLAIDPCISCTER